MPPVTIDIRPGRQTLSNAESFYCHGSTRNSAQRINTTGIAEGAPGFHGCSPETYFQHSGDLASLRAAAPGSAQPEQDMKQLRGRDVTPALKRDISPDCGVRVAEYTDNLGLLEQTVLATPDTAPEDNSRRGRAACTRRAPSGAQSSGSAAPAAGRGSTPGRSWAHLSGHPLEHARGVLRLLRPAARGLRPGASGTPRCPGARRPRARASLSGARDNGPGARVPGPCSTRRHRASRGTGRPLHAAGLLRAASQEPRGCRRPWCASPRGHRTPSLAIACRAGGAHLRRGDETRSVGTSREWEWHCTSE